VSTVKEVHPKVFSHKSKQLLVGLLKHLRNPINRNPQQPTSPKKLKEMMIIIIMRRRGGVG
jgi:hypothetical protein